MKSLILLVFHQLFSQLHSEIKPHKVFLLTIVSIHLWLPVSSLFEASYFSKSSLDDIHLQHNNINLQYQKIWINQSNLYAMEQDGHIRCCQWICPSFQQLWPCDELLQHVEGFFQYNPFCFNLNIKNIHLIFTQWMSQLLQTFLRSVTFICSNVSLEKWGIPLSKF